MLKKKNPNQPDSSFYNTEMDTIASDIIKQKPFAIQLRKIYFIQLNHLQIKPRNTKSR